MDTYEIIKEGAFKKGAVVQGKLCPCDGFKSLIVEWIIEGGKPWQVEKTKVKPEFFKKIIIK